MRQAHVHLATLAEPDRGGGSKAPATSSGVDPRLASVLCYAGWWVSGLVFLFAERQHRGVRFHAAQSVIVFGVVSVVLMAIGGASALALLTAGPAFQALQAVGNLVWLGAMGLWMILLVTTWRGGGWRIPLAGDLAETIAGR